MEVSKKLQKNLTHLKQQVKQYPSMHGETFFSTFDCFKGLSGDKSDLELRQDVFGSNTIPPKPPKTFLELVRSYF